MNDSSDQVESTLSPQTADVKDFWSDWQLHSDRGRQTWQHVPGGNREKLLADLSLAFKFDKYQGANSSDKVYRSQALSDQYQAFDPSRFEQSSHLQDSMSQKALLSCARGVNFYSSLQAADGHWPGDYGGPLFLLPGLVVTSYITQTPFSEAERVLMKRYMLNHQNMDGGWGLHIEGESTMFGTVMQYVALRILGMKEDDKFIEKARSWIYKSGGAVGIPPWGKFYLSVLGVYEWQGCDSLLPEMWLLPESLPVHPKRYWCHARMVYLPMAYCYGKRVTGQITQLVQDLRNELYTTSYSAINWSAARSNISETDVYSRPSSVLKILNKMIINPYERIHHKGLRKKALGFTLAYVNAEDEQTKYVDIGPVNQIINSICVWDAYGRDSDQFQKHVDRWRDYLWVAEDGMKMNGYNGSQLWDTAFAVQAIVEGGMEQFFPEVVQNAYQYIDMTQVSEDVENRSRFFRHISKGGWPFSTLDHGWPISDCTAEGLSAVLAVHKSRALESGHPEVNADRLYDAVNVILSMQNSDGGWATYENTRGGSWLELLNPSGIFGDIMIDYSYTECTSACVRALCEFREEYKEHRSKEINTAVHRGILFIKSKQLPDGSWIGSWAVCFTYGTWFGIEGLAAAGEATYSDRFPETSMPIKNACAFLLSTQNADGGWGESYQACVEKRYVQAESSQVVNTAWALLSLMAADYPDKTPIERGIAFLMSRQEESGDWPQEGISGVFNANCMITYTAYRNVFPLWALGRYCKKYHASP